MVAGVGNRRRVGRTRGLRSFMIFLLSVLVSSISLSLLRRLENDGVTSFLSGSLDTGSDLLLVGESSLYPERSSLWGSSAMSWVVGVSIYPPSMHLVGEGSLSA